MDNIQINDELKSLMPSLATEEFNLLEQSIVAEGIRDPLIIWGNNLIDGHNRLNIARKHGLKFKTITKEFDNIEEVKLWIIKNQLGRRNLTNELRAYYIGKYYNSNKLKYGSNQHTKRGEDKMSSPQTLSEIAKEQKINGKTLKRNGRYANGIDKIKEISPELAGNILSGETKITKEEVSEVEPEIIKKIAKDPELLKQVAQGKTIKGIVKQQKLQDEKQKRIDEVKATNSPIIKICDYGDFLSTVPDKSIDLLITDPPYSTDIENISQFVETWLPLAMSKLKDTGRGYICIGAYPVEVKAYLDVFSTMDNWILDNPLIWTYRNTLGVTPKRKYNLNYQMILHVYFEKSADLHTEITNEMFSVQDINAPDGRQGDRFFKWQKPDELANRLIRHSSNKGDSVIDCFAGCGTFLLAANSLGRIASGCEVDEETAQLRGCQIEKL